jgi:hypothetical protein
MIDFRYHIISIVAVLLALSIGIITGSAFLGGPLLQQLENRVDSLERNNEELLARVRETEREATHQESALSAFESTLTNGSLSGRRIVLWLVGESEADTVDAVRASLEEADGEIATTVVATSRFDLGDLAEREDLTTTLDLPDVTAADLRVDIAELLGSRAGTMAAQGEVEAAVGGDGVQARLQEIIEPLRDMGYLEIEVTEEGDPIFPAQSSLVVVAGSPSEAPFDAGSFVTHLASSFAERDNTAIVVEGQDSAWGVVETLRADGDAREIVSSVDDVDKAAGRISLPLALERAADGPVGHYGDGQDADAPVPQASPEG